MSRHLFVASILFLICQPILTKCGRSEGETQEIEISGEDVCNINGRSYFGPNSTSSLEIRNKRFKGCRCIFTLSTDDKYDHIILYLHSRLRDKEVVTVATGDSTLEFNEHSRDNECVYLKGTLNLSYQSCESRGNLDMDVIWANGKRCPAERCMMCSMTKCYKHHDVEHKTLYVNREFYMTDDFRERNCEGRMAAGWIAFIVLACLTVVSALVAYFVHKKRKAKKTPISSMSVPSFFPSYPVVTPMDFEGSHSKGIDVSKSVFTTGGDMPIDSSNAYAPLEHLPTESADFHK